MDDDKTKPTRYTNAERARIFEKLLRNMDEGGRVGWLTAILDEAEHREAKKRIASLRSIAKAESTVVGPSFRRYADKWEADLQYPPQRTDPPEEKVRVLIFKATGKFYDETIIDYPRRDDLLTGDSFVTALRAALYMPEHGRCRYSGMFAVCETPNHQHQFPLMVLVPER